MKVGVERGLEMSETRLETFSNAVAIVMGMEVSQRGPMWDRTKEG